MKKSIFKKIGGLFLGLAMAIGVGVAVASNSEAVPVSAALNDTAVWSSGTPAFGSSYASGTKTLNGISWFVSCAGNNTSLGWNSSTQGNNNNASSAPLSTISETTKYGTYQSSGGWKVGKIVVSFSNADSVTGSWYIWYSNNNGSSWTQATTGSLTSSTASITYDHGSNIGNSVRFAFGFGTTKTTKTRINISNIQVYEYEEVQKYTVSFVVNTAGYGTVSQSSITDIPSGTSISTSNNTVTINGTTVTATPTTKTDQYTYAFTGWSNNTGTVTAARTITANFSRTLNKFTVSDNITNGSLDDTSSIEYGGELIVTIEPETGYKLPAESDITVMMGSTDITSSVIYDDKEGSIYYDNVTGNITITATCPLDAQGYGVSWGGCSNVTIDGPSNLYVGDEAKEYSITAASGYKLPEKTDVTVTGATSAYEKTAYNEATLTLSNPTGEVTISLAGIALENYGITFSGENYTHIGSETIQELGQVEITLTAAEHYDLPADVTVDGATKESYTKSTGKLVISNPKGAVTVTVDPVARAHYTISVSGAGDYASHFSYSGHENGIYATESIQVTISPDTSTDDIYIISASNINVTGATKGAYSNNKLTISNPTGAVTITVTPKLRTVTGIELTSSPSTKTYNIGDSFSTNNWVVKQKYSDGTTGNENIVNQCDIVFDDNNPAAMFEEGSHTVKFVYDGMSTISTNITVNKVTHSGSITFTKTNVGAGRFLIATKDSSSNWYYLPAAATSSGPAKVSLSMKDGLPSFDSTVDDSTYMWNLTVSSGKYTIKNDDGKYLYTTTANDGLRVGTTSDTWTITSKTNGYSMKGNTNSRYAGVYVSGSNWRSYTSSSQANYSGTGENIVFYTRTETPSTHLYAGIVAELPAGAQYYAGQTVEKSDLVVTGYYDDGESFEVDSSDFEISGNVLSLGLNTITVTYQGKTSAIKVNALQRSGTLIDARIETSTGWKQNYFYDGEQLEWDFTNINLVAYYDDEHTVSVSLQGLVESEKVEVSPEYPTYETTSFTITGSYDDGEVEVDINEEYNTVDGITVTDRAISSLSSWNPSSKFSFTVYEEAKFDFDNIGSVNLVWNDGTPATGAQQIKPLIEDGRLEIGLFKWEDYSAAASIDFEPEIVVDSNFTWSLDYNGYFMALSSPLTRTRKQVQFEVLPTPDSCTAYINSTATAYDGSPSASKFYNNMSVTVSSTDSTDVKDLISVSEVSGSRLYSSPNTSYFSIGGNATTGGSITLQVKSGYFVTSVSMVLFNGSDTAGQTFKVNHESFTYNTKSVEQSITAYTYSNSIKLESVGKRTWIKNIFITMEKASAAAETYAKRFNEANVCGTDDYTAAIGSVWAEQAAYYSNADIEVRNAIKNGVADQTGSTQLEQCLARYDAAVSKASLHGTTSAITDFMSRNPSNGARINSILALNEVDNSVWVIAAVALVGLTAIGGYFFYRKRKEI